MPRSAAQFTLELRFEPGRRSASRLSRAIVAAIADGQLADGDAVPSTRTTAASLGIARSVVVEAYAELTAAGFFVTRAGGGTRVERGAGQAARAGALTSAAADADPHPAAALARRAAPGPATAPGPTAVPGPGTVTGPATVSGPEFDLRPGQADITLIDARDWTRAWRAAARGALAGGGTGHGRPGSQRDRDPADRLPPDREPADWLPGGLAATDPEEAVAAYLRQTRGLAARPEDLLLFPSVAAAIAVLADVTARHDRTLAFENPGYDRGRRAFASGGARIRAVPVDRQGLRVAELRATDWGAYVTPAHQFPTGARMSVSRRTALLDWAAGTGGLIFEDDYDGEFRYDVPPMPPLKAMSPAGRRDRVVYIGTSSKILAPQLRVAWALVPGWLRAAAADGQQARGAHVSGVAAAALARLITSRAVTRQFNRGQRAYAARQAAFTAACRAQLPGVRLLGIDAGLHILLALPAGTDDVAVAAELGRRGVVCAPLGWYWQRGTRPREAGLVCGYASLPETRVAAAIARIRETLTDLGFSTGATGTAAAHPDPGPGPGAT